MFDETVLLPVSIVVNSPLIVSRCALASEQAFGLMPPWYSASDRAAFLERCPNS